MSSPAVSCVNHLIEEYRRFLRSTYRLADPRLRDQFERHINEAEVLVKGPYATLAQDYALAKPLAELIEDKVGHPDLARLHWSFKTAPIYRHQERAFQLVDAEARNCVIKTGTGSGKTEAFLLPLLSGVLKLRDQGVQGTKAIIIYPMNALANDQLTRFRTLTKGSGVGLTFAMYTGDSDEVAAMLGEAAEGNEISRRDQIRRTPPDIILTNYKQLEFMLIRKDDRAIFTDALRFLVLDEIHSYRGALATEIAYLIRRLKARCGLHGGGLRCIGTSATVAEGAGGDEALVKFVSSLFGEPFETGDIVGETLALRQEAPVSYLPPFVAVEREELIDFPVDDRFKVLELARRITGREPPQEGTLTAKIAAMFQGNRLVELMDDACGAPRSLSELADRVLASISESRSLGGAGLQSLLEAYLILGSIGDPDDPPILRPKLHTFFSGVYEVGICINPACRTLVKDGSDQCPVCMSAVRPAVLCRTCGQDFYKVRFPEDETKPPEPNDSFKSDDLTGFITPFIHVESGEEEEEEDDEEGAGGKRSRKKTPAARQRLVDAWICRSCGMVHPQKTEQCANPECHAMGTLTPQKVMRGKGNTCPVCNNTYTKGDILTLLRSGVASSNSLLATHHLDRLDGEDRKLLLFADNRQEAAHQAGYMQDRQRTFAVRHAIEKLVRESGEKGIALVDLPQKLLGMFQDMGLARRNLTTDEREKWLRTLLFEASSEFCRSTQQRLSLENLALVEVGYEFLDKLGTSADFAVCCREAGCDVEVGLVLVRAILDHMRRHRAVGFDFFQEYIDPHHDKWAMIQAEPYCVSIPEYERAPVFYMLGRNQAARAGVSGFKFSPFIKDSSRGGASTIPRILAREGIQPQSMEAWTRKVVALLQEEEILESPVHLPQRVRSAIGNGSVLQIASRVIRLHPAGSGYRCRKCQIWRPYRGMSCYSTRCSGGMNDLVVAAAEPEHYYVKLYTSEAPRRMKALEHTAQISQEERAKRETDFKERRLDVLVCSPTLELGVDIGPLATVLLRNCPPAPANYIQRAGRAGRRLRMGFVSTFCGMGPHDRHCFEDPAWLVRGEFFPPTIRLDNSLIKARHIRSFVLENLDAQVPNLMGEMVDDLNNPQAVDKSKMEPVHAELKAKEKQLLAGALQIFGGTDAGGREYLAGTIGTMPGEIGRILDNWFLLVKRIHQEYMHYSPITADRKAKQKADARKRAYYELTLDKQDAYVLNYFSAEGLLPSYQFPTDTFSLEPGVNDTDMLRRPAWVALFEFAPGNMVYANGHKLRSIRASFEGKNRAAGGGLGGSLEASGRVRPFCFCTGCGYASEETRNNCPQCGTPLGESMNIAFVESFEAEQFTQISSAEEARDRVYFERQDHLIQTRELTVEVYPYPFSHLEMCRHAKILVTNNGKRPSYEAPGMRFDLCSACGKHRPGNLTEREEQKWDQDHALRCSGGVDEYILGYEFFADALVMPLSANLFGGGDGDVFARTLGTALVAGAGELLEIEPDEIAFFYHPAGAGGREIIFYETIPGGAGYLQTLAARLADWADISMKRLYSHDCHRACYRCLKSYRNQTFHKLLDKNIVRDALFQFANGESIIQPIAAKRNDGFRMSEEWIGSTSKEKTSGTVIEQKLLESIRAKGRLPEPVPQKEFHADNGALITVADFAYEEKKIAIYCDGFAYHGNKETLSGDAQKRNELQARGWAVLTFWGKTILKHPERCEEQIWRVFQERSFERLGPSGEM